MKIIQFIKKIIGSISERFVVFSFAFALSQMPTFMNQYSDAMVGSIFKSKKIVYEITLKAKRTDKSLSQFIQKHLDSGDLDFKSSGEQWKKVIDDLNNELLAQKKILEASVWTRPFVFIRYMNPALVKNIKYKPALPFSLESLVYIFIGILLGMLFFRILIQFPLKKVFGSKKIITGSSSQSPVSKKSNNNKKNLGNSKGSMPNIPTFELSEEFKHLKK